MTISCLICGHKVRSSLPDEDKAHNHVIEQMTAHLKRHPEEAKRLSQVLDLCAVYFLVCGYVEIPPEEAAFLQSFNELQSHILELFGIQTTQPN